MGEKSGKGRERMNGGMEGRIDSREEGVGEGHGYSCNMDLGIRGDKTQALSEFSRFVENDALAAQVHQAGHVLRK